MNWLEEIALPWWGKWAIGAAVVAACCLYTGIEVASHYEDKLAAIRIVGAEQARKTAKVEAKQKEVTKNVQRKTVELVRSSDDYYRLRLKPGAGAVPVVPGSTGGTYEATPPGALDSETCSAADGSADAITILMWQRWYLDLKTLRETVDK